MQFNVPYKRVRGWAWESYWIIGGLTCCFAIRYLGMSLGDSLAKASKT